VIPLRRLQRIAKASLWEAPIATSNMVLTIEASEASTSALLVAFRQGRFFDRWMGSGDELVLPHACPARPGASGGLLGYH
jgi:hypothetical protein